MRATATMALFLPVRGASRSKNALSSRSFLMARQAACHSNVSNALIPLTSDMAFADCVAAGKLRRSKSRVAKQLSLGEQIDARSPSSLERIRAERGPNPVAER